MAAGSRPPSGGADAVAGIWKSPLWVKSRPFPRLHILHIMRLEDRIFDLIGEIRDFSDGNLFVSMVCGFRYPSDGGFSNSLLNVRQRIILIRARPLYNAAAGC